MRVHKEIIRLHDLSFRYPDSNKPVLQGVSAAIGQGERIVICGPSGCGKSTLLFLLNRLYPANCDGILDGEIRLFGKQAADYAPGEANRRIATVFQDPDSQFCMPTVEEELAFTLENLHVPPNQMDARIEDVLNLTLLSNWRHATINKLSGGIKQRIAVACALIMKPDVLLLDEPLAHLDPLTAQQFVFWLDGLQKNRQLTIIAVEHRLASWGSFFEREIRLDHEGRLIRDGRPPLTEQLQFPRRLPVNFNDEALTAENLALEINGEMRLLPLSFGLKRGEVAIVAGPNGSGKTTLLKALSGIHQPRGGLKAVSRAGYVPQSPEFMFLTPSVTQELAYSGASSLQEIRQLMNKLNLSGIAESNPFSVSHGQKRRVAIGAMLADKRLVLLLDEPTAGQDDAALLELHELICQRAAEGTAFLIVTHDMSFAAAIADSLLLLKEGSLTGKFSAPDVWKDHSLLLDHHLLPPEGAELLETPFT